MGVVGRILGGGLPRANGKAPPRPPARPLPSGASPAVERTALGPGRGLWAGAGGPEVSRPPRQKPRDPQAPRSLFAAVVASWVLLVQHVALSLATCHARLSTRGKTALWWPLGLAVTLLLPHTVQGPPSHLTEPPWGSAHTAPKQTLSGPHEWTHRVLGDPAGRQQAQASVTQASPARPATQEPFIPGPEAHPPTPSG